MALAWCWTREMCEENVDVWKRMVKEKEILSHGIGLNSTTVLHPWFFETSLVGLISNSAVNQSIICTTLLWALSKLSSPLSHRQVMNYTPGLACPPRGKEVSVTLHSLASSSSAKHLRHFQLWFCFSFSTYEIFQKYIQKTVKFRS